MYADDTIAALATPPGPGGIGIIRVSGPRTLDIAARVFAAAHTGTAWQSHRLYHGQLLDPDGRTLDEGLAVVMRAPHSYTGEDVLELHCHGSPVVLRRVLAHALHCGARPAAAGEFTRRAFLNGRLDLAQAEAVLDLIRARTPTAAALASAQLGGRLSQHLAAVRRQLIGLKALLEVQIDFAEEDVEVSTTRLMCDTDDCLVTIQDLVNTFSAGALRRDGLRAAIVGKPNVGKSSLLNALLGEERALVTPVAGTTRDTIEETADFDGVPVVLTDTAGLRRAEQADAIERLGMERTGATIGQADVLLTVLDASTPLDGEDFAALQATAGRSRILVLNKIDLPPIVSERDLSAVANGGAVVRVSAKDGEGLAALRQAVVSKCLNGHALEIDEPVLTNVRHRDALEKACQSLTLAHESLRDGRPPDLVAVDVQDAIDHIGAITGAVTSEEVLDRVFSEFCIGK